MNIETLNDLYVQELRKLYHIETELVDVLDEMARDAGNDDISDAFAEHGDETSDQVDRLERAFEAINQRPEQQRSPVFDGLVEDKREFLDSSSDQDLQDMYYLGAGMMTERVEISGYEGALMLADRLDLDREATEPLETNLDEEQSTLKELETVAEGGGLERLI